MKKILKSSLIGIGISVAIFVLIGIVFDFRFGGTFLMKDHSFTKMAFGCIFVGIGFGAPSAIYENDALSYPLQVIFHLGIGFAVLMIISFAVGWIPAGFGIGGMIGYVAADLAIVLLIWYCFYRHYKKEADEINRKILEKTGQTE